MGGTGIIAAQILHSARIEDEKFVKRREPKKDLNKGIHPLIHLAHNGYRRN